MVITGKKSRSGSSIPGDRKDPSSGFTNGSFFEVDQDGHFLKVPPSLEKMTGFSGDELDLLSLHSVTFTEDGEKITSAMNAIKSGAPLVAVNIEIFSEDAGSHPVELILLPTIIKGEVRGMWGTMKDITQRKNLERELEVTQEIQEASQRFLSDFVSLLTREIRQPLTTILLTLEMLDSGSFGELTDTQGLRVSQLIEIIDRLKTTLNEALDMSRNMDEQKKLERRSASMEDMIRSVVGSREDDIKQADVKIVLNLPAHDVTAEVDRKAMMQVISTLLDRTIRSSPRSGQIVLELEDREKDVLFSISDSGEGMPENEMLKVFEKLHLDHEREIKDFREGMNLYMTKRIIERHGGRIWCESFVGLGSTYLFLVPKMQEKEDPTCQ